MTCIKMCGLSMPEDIQVVNELRPEYVGFVFWEKSKRNVSKDTARALKEALDPEIKAVGVFVDEAPEKVAALLTEGIIDIAQLHGNEDEEYIRSLKQLAGDKPIIKAFVMKSGNGDEADKAGALETLAKARQSSADYILLDSGKGTGQTFNWGLIKEAGFDRPYFLAGGLGPENAAEAVAQLHPFAVDVSSGIETDGFKDEAKMKAFIKAVRG